jgi:hypothetical protein
MLQDVGNEVDDWEGVESVGLKAEEVDEEANGLMLDIVLGW